MSEFAAEALDALAAETADTTSTEATEVQPDEGQGQPTATDAPSAVQPEGQGQPDAETGLYDLSTVPEEYRENVRTIAEEINRNVNSKLQEAAAYRKQWEPYSELGLTDVDPQGLGGLLEFASSLVNDQGEIDPDAARESIVNFAQALGIDLDQAGYEGGEAGEAGTDAPLTRAEFEAWQQDQQAQAEAVRQQEAERHAAREAINAEWAEVQAQHEQTVGKPLSQEEQRRVIDLAKRFRPDQDNPLKTAYQMINDIGGGAQAALVNGQPTPPAPAEPAGRASSPVQPVDNFDDAIRLHRERNASR